MYITQVTAAKIDYVSARNGAVHFYADEIFVGHAKTATQAANLMMTQGVASEVFGSETMNFASDHGFDSDIGAQLLLKRAYELI